jgi:hypothetical protein
MEHDEIITLPDTGTEITVGTALADIQRAAGYLAHQIGNDDAQGLAADLNTATDLLTLLASEVTALRAALEHLATPNRAIRPTGNDAQAMAQYAREALDA